MIPNAKPLNPECLTRLILSQTDNKRNHLAHSYSRFCTSVHFPFIGNQRERERDYFLWSNARALNYCHIRKSCIALSTCPEYAHSLFSFSPVFFSSPFNNFTPPQPPNIATTYLQGPSVPIKSGSSWPHLHAIPFLVFSSLFRLFPYLQGYYASHHMHITI